MFLGCLIRYFLLQGIGIGDVPNTNVSNGVGINVNVLSFVSYFFRNSGLAHHKTLFSYFFINKI